MGDLIDVFTIKEWGHLFKPPVPYLHELDIREFYLKMDLLDDGSISSSVKGLDKCLNKETLGIIFDVPTTRIQFIKGCRPSMVFTKIVSKRENLRRQRYPKSN